MSDGDHQAALRTQLSEMNRRSQVYLQRLWQIPLFYLAASGIVLGIGDDQKVVGPVVTLVLLGLLGAVLAMHMWGMRDGSRRAVEHLQLVEQELNLDRTAEWKPGLYIDLLILLIAGTATLMFARAVYLGFYS